MKFSDKYPNAEVLQAVGSDMRYTNNKKKCCMCDQLTAFMDEEYECYLCSEECLSTLIIGACRAFIADLCHNEEKRAAFLRGFCSER